MYTARTTRDLACTWKPRGFRYSEDRLARLLREVQQTGSLRAAARRLGMDPGNGLRMIRSAEAVMGTALVRGRTGGRSGGPTKPTGGGGGGAPRTTRQKSPLGPARSRCVVGFP